MGTTFHYQNAAALHCLFASFHDVVSGWHDIMSSNLKHLIRGMRVQLGGEIGEWVRVRGWCV